MDNKKSFILYLDTIEQFEMLTDEQAGVLIKALLRYCDTGERLETEDGMLVMAFSFLSSQIDRDSEKWDNIRQKRRDAINKRWKKESKDSESEDTNEYKSIQKIQKNTNDTVNVNDSVNDNENDNVNDDDNDNENGNENDDVDVDAVCDAKRENKRKNYFNKKNDIPILLRDDPAYDMEAFTRKAIGIKYKKPESVQ